MSSHAASLSDRHRRLVRRGLPVAALAAVSFAVGLLVGAGHVSSEEKVVQRLAEAWRKGDYAGVWAELTTEAQHRYDAASVGRAYRAAAATATTRSMTIG